MIQGKREKEIGPKRVQAIVAEADIKTPPYGYILAASANFSKESYDIFREELRKKGVMEFYLWGKAELEDMLYLPKNDRLLFTFFGISLVSKRRSRVTELRAGVITKNKLYKILGDNYHFNTPILVRDLKDIKYPYKDDYTDFDKYPRWKEYIAFEHHPLGILCHCHEYYAYIDYDKKEFDFTKLFDLTTNYHVIELDPEKRRIESEKHELTLDTWNFIPNCNKGYITIDGLIKYSDILLVDSIGDISHKCAHIYVDYNKNDDPFAGYIKTFRIIGGGEEFYSDEYSRIKIFPEKHTKLPVTKIYKKKMVLLNDESYKAFQECKLDELYDMDDKYGFLKPRDVIQIYNKAQKGEKRFIQITHKYSTTIEKYLTRASQKNRSGENIKIQLGSDNKNTININVYEFQTYFPPKQQK